MKKNTLYPMILILSLCAFQTTINAQVAVNVNLGSPPVWAKTAPVEVQYYYLPDIETYYDVPSHRYIYLRNGSWYRSTSLPPRYKSYDLYHSRPIYLTDYRGNTPYTFYKEHKVKYKGNGKWKRNGNDNGLHKGKDKGHDNGHNGKGKNKDNDHKGKK